MDLQQQAQAGLDSIEFPTDFSREKDVLSKPGVRTAPLREADPSAFESFSVGLSKSATAQVVGAIRTPKPFYMPTEEDLTKFPELTQGLSLDDQRRVLAQVSKEAAQAKREEILYRMETDRIQHANGGGIGLASELLSYLDPMSYAMNGGINAVMKVPKYFRLAEDAERVATRAAGSVALGGVTYIEESLRNQRMGKDEDDVLYAVAGAMAIGGVIAPLLARHAGKVGEGMDSAAESIDGLARHAEESSQELGKNIQKDLDEALVTHPERGERTWHQSDEQFDITGKDIELSEEVTAAGKEGALTENFTEVEYQIAQRAEQLVQEGNVSSIKELKQLGEWLKKNPAMTDGVRAAFSKSPVAQVIASHLGEIATGTRGKVATTAAMHKNMIESRILLDINTTLKHAQAEFLSKRGIKPLRNPLKYHGKGKVEFDTALRLELAERHAGKASTTVDDSVRRAADAWDTATKKMLTELQEAGWEGAAAVKWKSGFFPLYWSGQAIEAIKQVGKLPAARIALSKGYTSVGFSEELSNRLSNVIINRALSDAADLDFNPAALFTKAGRGDLERMLAEAGVSELDKRGIMKMVDKETTNGMAKRTDIDLTVEYDGVKILDMVQGDMSNMISRWTQRNSGMAGLAKKGITNYDMIDSFKKLAKSQAAGHGEDVKKLGHSVDAIFDTILAKPVYKGVGRNTRRMMDWALTTRLGQVAFAQVAEMSNITGTYGMFNTLKHLPEATKLYRNLLKAIDTGDWSHVDKKFMQELQVFGGNMFDEHLTFKTAVRMDESADVGWLGTFDNIQAVATDALGHVSGMYSVKGIEQVLVIMLQSDKVARLLRGKNALQAAKKLRLNELGWGDATITRISNQVNKHAVFEKGVLDRLHLEKWDADARTEYLQGLHRHVRHTIQFPMAGEGMYWMHENTAALLMQFRSYPLLAIEKQTGRHLAAGDGEANAAFMYGLAFSSIASIMKTYTNSIGRSDREEYLKKRMNPTALAMQAFNYAPQYSVLNDAVGLLGQGLGYDMSGRYGGVAPVLSAVGQFGKGVTNVVGSMNPTSDVSLTERGVRNFASAIPYQNTVQMSLITNSVLNWTLNDPTKEK